jgi:hypothetical protein
MTDQTTSVQEPQPSSEPPTLAPPRMVRQGPVGKPRTSANPLADDDSSTEADSTTPRGRSRSTRGAAPTTSTASAPSDGAVAAIKSELQSALLGIGGVLAIPLPVTGVTVINRAEIASNSIIEIARSDPKLWARLQKILAATKYSDLVYVGVCLVTAVTVDLHIVPPMHPLPQNTIGDVLEKFTVKPENPAEQNGTQPTPQPAYSSQLDRLDVL